MKLLITGICGFVGSSSGAGAAGESRRDLDLWHRQSHAARFRVESRACCGELGVTLVHGDIRMASDFESLPAVDWVIDAAANPSVLAGIQTGFSSRQLIEHNLGSVVNVLEYCKAHQAGLLLMSTSRVYSIPALTSLPLKAQRRRLLFG